MSDVFISYSRADTQFVRQLHEALGRVNRDTWVDWNDIPVTAEWLTEIFKGIDAADNFVFVISPDSVVSRICLQEIKHACANNKRLIPVLYRKADRNLIPTELARLNYIFFNDERSFNSAFGLLLDALDTDLTWKRVHTSLLLRCLEWERHDKDSSFLMRGNELIAAEAWLQHPLTPRYGRKQGPAGITIDESAQSVMAATETITCIKAFIESSIRVRTETHETEQASQRALAAIEAGENKLSARLNGLRTIKLLFSGGGFAAVFYAWPQIENFAGKPAPYCAAAAYLFSIAIAALRLEAGKVFGESLAMRRRQSRIFSKADNFAACARLFDYSLLSVVVLVSAREYVIHLFPLLSSNHWSAGLAESSPLWLCLMAIVLVSLRLLPGFADCVASRSRSSMAATVSLCMILAIWGMYSVYALGAHLPPPLYPFSNIHVSITAYGWLHRASFLGSGMLFFLIALSASFFVLVDDENFATKAKMPSSRNLTLHRWHAYGSLFVRFVFPIFVAFLWAMLIPDYVREHLYQDAPMAGVVWYMIAPEMIKIAAVLIVSLISIVALLAISVRAVGAAQRSLEEASSSGWFKGMNADEDGSTGRNFFKLGFILAIQLLLIVSSHGSLSVLASAMSFGVGCSVVLDGVAVLSRCYSGPVPASSVFFPFEPGQRWIASCAIAVTLTTLILTAIGLMSRRAMMFSAVFSLTLFLILQVPRLSGRRATGGSIRAADTADA